MILKRLSAFAKKAMELLNDQFLLTTEDQSAFDSAREMNWKRLFKSSSGDYDLLIKLKKEVIAHPEQNIAHSYRPKSKQIKKKTEYKNLEGSGLLIDLDLVQKYLEELQFRFKDTALFFYDQLGGDVIGVVWAPKTFVVAPFKLGSSMNSVPQKKKGKTFQVQSDLNSMIEDIKILGTDLVEEVQVLRDITSKH